MPWRLLARAARRAPALPSLPRPRPLPRAFSSPAGSAPTPEPSPTPESGAEARMREAAEGVARNVEAGVRELQALHGGEHAHLSWMSDYYKSLPAAGAPPATSAAPASHRFLVPAFAMACADPRHGGAPSLQAKTAVFFAHALRGGGVPAPLFAQTAAAMTMAPGADVGLVLAVMHLVGSPVAKAVSERLALSVRRSGSRPLIEAGQHVARVPLEQAVDVWPMPSRSAEAAAAAMAAHGSAAGGGEGPAPAPHEVTALFPRARAVLGPHDYLLVCATAVLESQWAAFYATGEPRFVRRVAAIASGWHEPAEVLPDAVAFLLDVSKPLPSEAAPDAASCAAAGGGDARAPAAVAESARSARAHVSRAAAWSLLTHARRHPRVTEALAAECGLLAQFAADASARDAREVAATGLSSAAARARLEVLPALLHLIARSRLDADSRAPPSQEVLDVLPRS